jgi:hypothetical protein
LGAKYFVVLCAGSTLLLVEDVSTSVVNAALVGVSLGYQASPSRVWLFPGLTNLDFLLRENFLLCSSYLPLGVPNWTVKLYQHRAASRTFSGAITGEKEDFCKGSFARTSFTLF